ncbi:HB2J protein, partial [Eurystomus gularis]|nr:HB2J protein [Eurystomus gularis]
AVLVALVLLGAQVAGGQKVSAVFQLMGKGECQYLNGTERVRYLQRYIYNREQFIQYDSDVGLFVGDTPLGETQAKYWNSQPDILEQIRAAGDTFCRQNCEVYTPFIVPRRGER